MPEVSMKHLLEAGVHFGHQTHRWNPKMRPFIFAPRNGIYIIDLEKTVKYANEGCAFVKSTIAEGGKVLFVATKKQAKEVARQAADRAGMPHVTERWLGGTLTNFATIRRGCEKLDHLEGMKADGTYDLLPKKETVVLDRKRKKLEASLGGVRHMKTLPSALFVVDPDMERIAVAEANRLGIPVVAIVDTNCDPDRIDYVIPGNDDALKSVTLFVNLIADACLEGAAVFEQRIRQVGAPGQQPPQQQTQPAVERGIVKKPASAVRNIPAEIDYRVDRGLVDVEEDQPTVEAAPAEEAVEAEAAEAAPVPAPAPAAKLATAAADKPAKAKAKAEKSDKPADKPKKK